MASADDETTKIDATDATPAEDVTAEQDPVVDADATGATEPAVTHTTAAPAPSGPDRKRLGLIAGGVAALALAFILGLAVNDHDGRGDRGGRFEQRSARDGFGGGRDGGRGGFQGGRGERGAPGMPGGGGMPGGDGRGMPGGGPGGHMDGGPGGGMRGMRGHGGGIGVVTKVDGDEVTIETLDGNRTVVATLGKDTEVTRRGDNGARDVEDATASDIDEGDIVAVRADRSGDDSKDDDSEAGDDEQVEIDAKAVFILRDGDA